MEQHGKSAAVTIPELTSARLLLRGHRPHDLVPALAMWADPGVTRYIGGRPFTEEETWARLLRYAGHWAWLGFGYWVIEDRDTGRFLGEIGFADSHREIEPSIQGVPELGWALTSSARGRGIATEAAQAALQWCAGVLRAPRTVCLIQPANSASIRVAAKCGFHEHCRTFYQGQPTILFDRYFQPRPDVN